MHALATSALVGLMALGPAAARQAKPAPDIPKRGDVIVVEGCLHGTTLDAAEPAGTDTTGLPSTRLTYRLKGKKDLLKQLREAHESQVVRLTGVLKSELPGGEAPGKRIGNTTISVGIAASSHQRGAPQSTAPSLPVLEVSKYEGLKASCR